MRTLVRCLKRLVVWTTVFFSGCNMMGCPQNWIYHMCLFCHYFRATRPDCGVYWATAHAAHPTWNGQCPGKSPTSTAILTLRPASFLWYCFFGRLSFFAFSNWPCQMCRESGTDTTICCVQIYQPHPLHITCLTLNTKPRALKSSEVSVRVCIQNLH